MSLYIQYAAAADQYIGRTVSGLNANEASFGVMPPTFKEGYEDVVEEIMHDSFMRYDEVSASFQRVIRMTMTCVVYHLETLKREYFKPYRHPMRNCTIFWNRYRVELREIVEIKKWKEGEIVKATGIPPHIGMIEEERAGVERIKGIEERIKRIEGMIERMSCQMNRIERNIIEGEGVIDGGMIRMEEIKGMIEGSLHKEIESMREGMIEESGRRRRSKSRRRRGRSRRRRRIAMVQVREGRFSRLPEGYEIPKESLMNAWIQYFLLSGDNEEIPPLGEIQGKEFSRKGASRYYVQSNKTYTNLKNF